MLVTACALLSCVASCPDCHGRLSPMSHTDRFALQLATDTGNQLGHMSSIFASVFLLFAMKMKHLYLPFLTRLFAPGPCTSRSRTRQCPLADCGVLRTWFTRPFFQISSRATSQAVKHPGARITLHLVTALPFLTLTLLCSGSDAALALAPAGPARLSGRSGRTLESSADARLPSQLPVPGRVGRLAPAEP